MNQQLRRKLDQITDILWAGGVTNPVTYIEQISYLIFLKLLDEEESDRELRARMGSTGGNSKPAAEKRPRASATSARFSSESGTDPGTPPTAVLGDSDTSGGRWTVDAASGTLGGSWTGTVPRMAIVIMSVGRAMRVVMSRTVSGARQSGAKPR